VEMIEEFLPGILNGKALHVSQGGVLREMAK
jgi:hypothetical protein